MSADANEIIRAVRRAVEMTGVDVREDDARARTRLETRVEIECRPLLCDCCGFFDDEDED